MCKHILPPLARKRPGHVTAPPTLTSPSLPNAMFLGEPQSLCRFPSWALRALAYPQLRPRRSWDEWALLLQHHPFLTLALSLSGASLGEGSLPASLPLQGTHTAMSPGDRLGLVGSRCSGRTSWTQGWQEWEHHPGMTNSQLPYPLLAQPLWAVLTPRSKVLLLRGGGGKWQGRAGGARAPQLRNNPVSAGLLV